VMNQPGRAASGTGRLTGRVAIVTGAGSKTAEGDAALVGTGKAIAIQMARESASVLVVDRHEDRAAATCKWIADEGGTAASLVTELTDPDSSKKIAQAALDHFGRIDILVANAAAYASNSFLETRQEELEEVIAVNLVAPYLQTQAVMPAMIAAGGGSVIYISSILAMRGPAMAPYAASKAGLMGLVTSLASTFGANGVRFNCVAPGLVDTPIRRNLSAKRGIKGSDDGKYASPLAIVANAWDIAHCAAFLASDEGRYISGLLIPVDGATTSRMF
jgi:NAD(P)-dependent dehydrogenase (short-subunit alcohol dehydrogenase family)